MTASIFIEDSFDSAHWLPNVPGGHKCARMHGHTYRIRIEVTGEVGAIQPRFRRDMNAIAKVLDEMFNGANPTSFFVGFALLVFNTGEGTDRRANYISNCAREEMLAAMKEFVARNEGRLVEPTGKQ